MWVALASPDVTPKDGDLPDHERLTFALRGVHLTLHRGQWLAILGRNGSGKSTLGRVVAGLSDISRGIVRGPTGQPTHSVRTSVRQPAQDRSTLPVVGLVFQNPDAQMVGETVAEDVSFGLQVQGLPPDEVERGVRRSLTKVGLERLRDQPIARLSGGQKQLLCAASALALHPDILVFDEATAMLDEGARRALLNLAHDLCEEGVAVVWITQHLEELAHADRVIVLEAGSIAFEGPPHAFVTPDPLGTTPCQRLGFPLPWASAVAMGLRQRGVPVPRIALTEQELAEDLRNLWMRRGSDGA
ncbi:ATP-binding cassette domain-containing protein [Alicyclobacillus sp.]|uniref:ATP-binding cassette domain-containing protein n=1 Tax=Alicyclobacillus sp. TaxID=61169 RepID=UPI0025BF01B9|nr:ATP-binding cassette domain-containing protein [Alicyclobacillus sp.]MCL6516696.1 ATP-binding cassette domain-containing protein [Alicyclobacillus sp.]